MLKVIKVIANVWTAAMFKKKKNLNISVWYWESFNEKKKAIKIWCEEKTIKLNYYETQWQTNVLLLSESIQKFSKKAVFHMCEKHWTSADFLFPFFCKHTAPYFRYK